MFVRQSKYNKLRYENVELYMKVLYFQAENKALHRQLLEKHDSTSRFSESDIKRLLQLCHPDKHGGSKMASDMTSKLLAMRK